MAVYKPQVMLWYGLAVYLPILMEMDWAIKYTGEEKKEDASPFCYH